MDVTETKAASMQASFWNSIECFFLPLFFQIEEALRLLKGENNQIDHGPVYKPKDHPGKKEGSPFIPFSVESFPKHSSSLASLA